MAQIDTKLVLGSSTIEMHVGNAPGTSGTNAGGPNEAPNVHPRSSTPAASNPKTGTFVGVKFNVPA